MTGKAALSGKYQAYPEYKDSGVEWLGKVPAAWSIARMDDLALTIRDQVTPSDIALIQVIHYSIPTVQEIGVGREEDGSTIDSNKFRVEKGDVLFSKLNPRKQTVVTVLSHENPVVASTEFIVLRSQFDNQKFLRYLLYSQELKSFVCSQVESATRSHQRINPAVISKLKFALPSKDEKVAIANFLDHETAKIDTLIDKQQQLIQLLKEKRQAVISHAVTKGLNPNAPMRDSGVEWLGEVPEHWEVTRIKYYTDVFEQGWSPQCDSRPAEDDEYGVLKVGCVNYGVFKPEENKALPKELEPQLQYSLKKNDLLISRANTKELVGSAAVVERNYDNLILCDKLYRIRFYKTVNPQLVAYFLSLPVVRQQIEIGATGASHSMQNIGQSTIKEMPVVVPPIAEANELVSKIKKKITVFETLENKAVKGIQLMQERRTALISAAVTGKIDVRNWQAS